MKPASAASASLQMPGRPAELAWYHETWYREGFADALRWVLESLDLSPENEDLIEEVLDA